MGFAVYGKIVMNPGTRAHPFMFPSFKEAVQKMEEGIRNAL
jgi:hypothetical protein